MARENETFVIYTINDKQEKLYIGNTGVHGKNEKLTHSYYDARLYLDYKTAERDMYNFNAHSRYNFEIEKTR